MPPPVSLLPGAVLVLLLVLQTCWYSRHTALIVLTGVLGAAAIALRGLLLRERRRTLLTHLLPALAYLLVAVGPWMGARQAITDAGNTVRFLFLYDHFKQEVSKTGSATMHEWLLGHQGAVEHAVIFDASHRQYRSKLYKDTHCNSHAFSPARDFYIVTRVCI